MAPDEPVLIIGGGIIGLTLGHALQKAGIPFQIYERDVDITSREQGWAITIHWALSTLRSILDEHTLSTLEEAQVDPEVGKNDTGNFLFLNLKTLETKFRIPPNERRRLNRDRFRRALYDGVRDHVHFGKRFRCLDIGVTGKGVTAQFEDGTSARGAMLIGAEGSNSQTRQILAPDAYRNRPIPVRFIGAAVEMTPDQVLPLREIDPLLFQGCHPDNGNFLWVSMISTPEANGSQGTEREHYLVQVNISWLLDGSSEPGQDTDEFRLAEMKRRADDFHPLLRNAVHSIPSGTPVVEVAMRDWPCLPWDNKEGRITLVGDSAHAMSMYRGEAANHGIVDAYHLAEALKKVRDGNVNFASAIEEYENEMRERTSAAVQLSRQACLDAHDYHRLNENSAVLKRRALE